MNEVDVAVVGAGAAGIFAAIWASRTKRAISVVALDSARRIGAKILISGGGRCNITHEHVDEKAFAGSTPAAIRKILRRFSAEQTVAFFESLGVQCKVESTGKVFPVSDRAQKVLDALLLAMKRSGAEIVSDHRVKTIQHFENSFLIQGDWGELKARKVILSTGGKSVPKTGSDGHGYVIARSLGHTCTDRIFAALVPLLLPTNHVLCSLAGISCHVTLEVRSGSGSLIKSIDGSLLCTHFGISGPAVLDVSRYFINARFEDTHARLMVNWLPQKTDATIELELQNLSRSTVLSWLRKQLPDRLAVALCAEAGVEETTPGYRLTRENRSALRETLTRMQLPVTGDRGFRYAEVTAGGVPLNELNLNTMESRRTPGLFLCGEICDVDGRIGGFNFQWAWSSGYVAGTSAAHL